MKLTWAATPDAGVAGYNVYYGNSSRNYQNQVAAGNNLTTVLSGLADGTQYYFAVTAVDAFGVESDFSGEAAYLMPGDQAPAISAISDQGGSVNQPIGPIGFTIGDAETPAASLTVSGSSSSTTLVPNSNIVFGGSGANRNVTITPATGQSGNTVITITVSDGIKTASASFNYSVQAAGVNSAPTISGISDQTVAFNQATAAIAFTIRDAETAAASLTVSGSSSATGLVPNANIVFGGSGQNRTVKVTPAANQSGTAQITVVVSDGTNTASSSFNVTVQPPAPNTPPTISAISAQTVAYGQATAALPFTIGDAETSASSLTVSGSSSATSLIPNANIVFSGSGASRTVKVTPAANQSGTAQITVVVSDGTNTASSSFNVTVQAPAPNTAPTISAIPSQTVNMNQATATIPFTIGDAETSASGLTVSGSSSATTLVPNANIVFSGSGASRTVKVTPAANQSGTAQITVVVSDGTNTASSSFNVTVQAPAPNTPPTISAISDQTVTVNQATPTLLFTVADAETVATSLTVSGSSSATTLVPNANIDFSGSGVNRMVKVTPATGQTGTAQITVVVSDGTNTTSTSFDVTVQAPSNTPPTISAIDNQSGYADHAVGPIAFTVNDTMTPVGNLTVSAVSSAQSVVPNANITFGGSGQNRTVTITPAAGQTGSADITLTVSDGTYTAQSSFTITFDQPSAMPKSELPMTSSYSGLFYEDDAVRLQSAGSFKVTVSSSGKYSGTVQMAGGRYAFSGVFGTFCQGTNVIVRKGFKPLVINFGVNAGSRFSGSLSDGLFASQMHGSVTTFNKVSHPAPFLGNYTLAVPSQQISTSFSLGNGFGSLSVDGSGMVKLSGVLADGTKVTQSSQISDDGTWPVFIPLYKGKGLIMAWISFANRADDDLHGQVNWIKQPDLLSRYYPGGFALAGDAIGSTYVPLPTLALNTQISRMQASGDADSVVTSIKVSPKTGTFKGSLIDKSTGKPSSFQGALLQKTVAGYGFILGSTQSLPVLLTQ